MKQITLFLMLSFLICCKNGDPAPVVKTENRNNSDPVISPQKSNKEIGKRAPQKREALLEKDLLFNGKLKRYFALQDFNRIFGKADSTRLMSIEKPCSYIFENEDGSKDAKDNYLYKNGSRFESSGEKVAVDEFKFTGNDFVLYKEKKWNATTSKADLQKLFPAAFENISTQSHDGQDNLESINLAEDEEGISDGQIRILFKNGKLYSLWWWFPC